MRSFHFPGRSPVYGRRAMCATSHPSASLTAIEVLREGGNAVDAAIAAVAASCVTESPLTGFGAGGFMLIHDPTRPEAERDVLVDHAALELADADRAEHEVGALDGVHEVSGRAKRELRAVLRGQAVEHVADPLEPVGVDVVQHDLVELEPLGLLQQGPVDERDPEPAAADDGELHEGDRTSTPAIALTYTSARLPAP
jgi:hypothetical protein